MRSEFWGSLFPPLKIRSRFWYTMVAMRARVQLWLLMLVALLNSGGAGYWVCHGQVRSGSFWLKVCSEDVSAPWSAQPPAPQNRGDQLDTRSCDCHFAAVDALTSRTPSSIATVAWDDAPLLLTRLPCAWEFVDPIYFSGAFAPPPQNPHTRTPSFRAPPAG
ncbi:MAG: hypothetical protein KatS3mg022_2020 [Armatimonadota bacterium]|nr:MAG: hypothetical protein KatS3mg022_2020 [Armatimonadota bacterium]GIV19582.1 MAG: hypothetical protein KatS3mg023_1333 [Armatimonadota bacterium]